MPVIKLNYHKTNFYAYSARDASFVVVSTAKHKRLTDYKQRMGWSFRWLSCHDSNFNHDYQVSFTQAEVDSGKINYNYRESTFATRELPGISVFVKDSAGLIYHSYSNYSRGLDNLNVTYQLLDLLQKRPR